MRPKIAIATLLGLILLLFIASTPAQAEILTQVEVQYENPDQLKELQALGLDIVRYENRFIEVVALPSELEKIRSLGYETEIVHPDLEKFYRSRLDPGKDMGGYMTLDEINSYIDNLIATNPDIVSAKISLGQTIEGRDMWAFKISDNPNIEEDETEILYASAIHAREVITPLVNIHFIDYLVANYPADPEVQYLVDNREMWFILCASPDGYYYNEVTAPDGGGLWRKNRRDNGDGTYGVDLNRNFSYQWAYNNNGSSPVTSAETYRGTEPFSEPESQNLRDFHLAHDFPIAVYFHAYGNVLYSAWNYNNSYTEDYDIFNLIANQVNALNGYTNGTGAGSVNGSVDDWLYGEQTVKNKTFSFTWEVGQNTDGFWPMTVRIPDLVEENLEPCLFMASVVAKIDSLYNYRVPESPVLSSPDTAETEDFELSWEFNDTLNPAVEFELLELTDHTRLTDSCDNFDMLTVNFGFQLNGTQVHSGSSSFYSGSELVDYRYILYDNYHEIMDDDTLRFWTWYELNEHYDYLYVVLIIDGSNFVIPGNITTADNPYIYNPGYGITGSSGGWVEAVFDLSAFAGQYAAIAIVYDFNGLSIVEGVYLDDIYPIDSFQTQTAISIESSESTYSFTGKPETDFYYMIRARDAEDQWSAYSNIEKTAVRYAPQYVCGDATGDTIVNVSDAVSIINFIFIGGASPEPYLSGDGNCDTIVNVSDAVMIINYIFIGGSPPCDPNNDGIPDC